MTSTPNTPSIGAQLVRQLETVGVDTVFGIPGSHNLPIFDGLASGNIRLISPRHEQGAGFGADGYARASGKPGVFVTTTGPGILNAATALATAHADSVPVLAISPGARVADEGRELGWLHESRDQHGSIGGLVKSIRCRSEEALYAAVAETFARWEVERTRPVHLDVPIDILAAPAHLDLPGVPRLHRPAPSPESIREALEAFTASQTPVIIAGGGAVDARSAVNEAARLLGAPIVTTRASAGLRESSDLPSTVLPYAPEALLDADLLLVVGSELSQRDLPPAVFARLGRMVRIDIEPSRLALNRQDDLAIVADASLAVDALNVALRSAGFTPRQRREERQMVYANAIAQAYPGPLTGFHRALAEFLSPDVVITGDSSQVSYLGSGAHYPFRAPRSFLYPDAFAPLGYGLPAALGAKIAQPEREVVALVGDGAFLFSVQELSTAVSHQIPILVVVVENGGYLEIEQEMEVAGVPPIGVRFAYPDPVEVSQAFGATAVRVKTVDEIARWAAFVRSKECTGPVVIALSEDDLR